VKMKKVIMILKIRTKNRALSSQMEVGNARSARTITSREERTVTDVKSQELLKIPKANLII